ncbi:MAG: hypothetical protein K1W34_13450 [Lachnospiraceae bacterium]
MRISLESQAKLQIQKEILQGKQELVWSFILEYENELRESFDYTEWQTNLFEEMSLEELGEKAMEFS